jgi:hypothetical protein
MQTSKDLMTQFDWSISFIRKTLISLDLSENNAVESEMPLGLLSGHTNINPSLVSLNEVDFQVLECWRQW